MEIVTVIAIIAAIAGITVPAYKAIKQSVQKMVDVSHLKKIGAAWYECAINRRWKIDGMPDDRFLPCLQFTSFARQLAGDGKTDPSDMVLNDASVYISLGDKLASKVKGKKVITYINNGIITWAEPYTYVTNVIVNNEFAFSYCFVINLPADCPLETTPLGYTRGLKKDGTWDEEIGLYGSKGGYVLYADGHVKWFNGDKPALFLKWDQSGYTHDIREAVPNDTWLACCNYLAKEAYKGETAQVIVYQSGTGGD
jgi:prepilin-type processing-associated H-X9-DG protein